MKNIYYISSCHQHDDDKVARMRIALMHDEDQVARTFLKLLGLHIEIIDNQPSFRQCFQVVLKSTAAAVHFFFFFLEKHFMCIVGPVLEEKVKLCFSNETWKYFIKKNFKIGFHSTIYIFKNYFITMFSIFNKISGI